MEGEMDEGGRREREEGGWGWEEGKGKREREREWVRESYVIHN